MVLCGENMVRKKSKIVRSIKVFKLDFFFFVPLADQLKPNFYNLPRVEQKIAKLDGKSNMYIVVKCP